MVSTYYLVKLLKKANFSETIYNIKDDPNVENDEQAVTVRENEVFFHKCRVCLMEGNIPIFSKNKNTRADLSQYLSIFGGIEISEHDKYPKFLCKSCFRSLETAIEFRKTAKETQVLMSKEIEIWYKNKNGNKSSQPEIKTEKQTNNLVLISPQKNNIHERQNNNLRIADYSKYYVDASITKDGSMFQCRICKKLIRRASREQHIIVHLPDSEFAYICEYCGKTYKKWPVFKTHILIHRNELAFQCNICPYKGRTKGHVKRHQLVHTQVYKYMCSQCPRKFLNVSNLNHHLRRHEEPKFRCETCDKSFYENPKLKLHIETQHLGLKGSFACNLCSNVYARKKHLLCHQIKVHKRKKVGTRALYHKPEFQKI